jgi:hypothetical protein
LLLDHQRKECHGSFLSQYVDTLQFPYIVRPTLLWSTEK